MANKPLPKITCNRTGCWKVQEYRGQKDCIHCQKPLNNWSVASQLLVKGELHGTSFEN
jgi:hypothetical protein